MFLLWEGGLLGNSWTLPRSPGQAKNKDHDPIIVVIFEPPLFMLKDRVKILGSSMPESYGQDDKVDAYRVKRGVAFQWHETKSVTLWIRLFKDIPGLTHILDFGVGTAAAAIGSWRCGITYEGVCVNKVHKDWLDNLMDNSMFAVVAEGVDTKATGNDKDFQAKVHHLFGPQVAEGMRMICAKKAKAALAAKDPEEKQKDKGRSKKEKEEEHGHNVEEDDE